MLSKAGSEGLEMTKPRRSYSLPNRSTSDGNKTDVERSDVMKLIRKFCNAIIKLTSTKETHESVIETDYGVNHRQSKDKTESHTPVSNTYGTLDDGLEFTECSKLTKQLEDCLALAKYCRLHCDLSFPEDLLTRISRDVCRMAHCEPCGVRGCVIHVSLEDSGRVSHDIGKVACDSSIVPTFELYLMLKEDARGWTVAHRLLFHARAYFCEDYSNPAKYPPKVLLDGFQLAKKKLYRPN